MMTAGQVFAVLGIVIAVLCLVPTLHLLPWLPVAVIFIGISRLV